MTLEQFSPVLPDNYRESSYPVAVYRWHADNPTDHAVTVSVLLSWTNMLGWFRDYSQNMNDSLDAGNVNHWVDTEEGAAGTSRGLCLIGCTFGRSKMNGTARWRSRRSRRPGWR